MAADRVNIAQVFPQGVRSFRFGNASGDLSGNPKVSAFIDGATSAYLAFGAPAESAIVSALTALLVNGPSQEKLKTQLGLTEGALRLVFIDPDLLTFDAIAEVNNSNPEIAEDARRVLAANVRAMALMTLASDFSTIGYIAFGPGAEALAPALDAGPNQVLFGVNDRMTAIVASLPRYQGLQPRVHSAIAHLVNAYGAAISLRIEDEREAAQYVMGLPGYLEPRINDLVEANTIAAADAALAVTSVDIDRALERFGDSLTPKNDGFLFPGPDYYEIDAGNQLVLRFVANTVLNPRHPLENDLHANGPVGSTGFFPGDREMVSVAVPAINSGEVSASLGADNEVTIVPAMGFTGLTYIDYTMRHIEGETATARIFVRVM